ncbi:MAG: DUF4287 domain-containing protein [Bacteroidetes bacterium]|nr:DUF4287 domain-containing protein [Bacteroidota bacterium]
MSFQVHINNINLKTGRSPEGFIKLEKESFLKAGKLINPIKTTEIANWLKADFYLEHDNAMAIYTIYNI